VGAIDGGSHDYVLDAADASARPIDQRRSISEDTVN
jgi:hypothetical protein